MPELWDIVQGDLQRGSGTSSRGGGVLTLNIELQDLDLPCWFLVLFWNGNVQSVSLYVGSM